MFYFLFFFVQHHIHALNVNQFNHIDPHTLFKSEMVKIYCKLPIIDAWETFEHDYVRLERSTTGVKLNNGIVL